MTRTIRSVPDPPPSDYHDPETRFSTSLTGLNDGLYLRIRDTKDELRTLFIGITPPGTDWKVLENTAVYHALDTMLRLTTMSVRADDEEVFEAIAEAIDGRPGGSAVSR